MASKLDILAQVMLSLKDDQNVAMNNINALLSNRESEVDLIQKIKGNIRNLSAVHKDMEETQAFIVQLTSSKLVPQADKSPIPATDADGKVGSDGSVNDNEPSEK